MLETATETQVHIRWMIRRDMPEVFQIEQQSFPAPWTEEDFLRCLRRRDCIGLVAEDGDKVVGYACYQLGKKRLRLLNLAVHPDYRHQGVGRQLVQKLASKLGKHKRLRLTIEVRETNLAAQLFFRSQEFRAVRVIRSFFEQPDEDGYLMEYRLDGDDPVVVGEKFEDEEV